jgi:hypothetical protein
MRAVTAVITWFRGICPTRTSIVLVDSVMPGIIVSTVEPFILGSDFSMPGDSTIAGILTANDHSRPVYPADQTWERLPG